jgi:hypothetical protein
MSLTIEQSPEEYSPVFNPLNFVVSSNNIAGHNFFFYKVNIKNAAGDIISQNRYSPRPDNEYLLFDVARELEKYTSYDINGIALGTTGVRYATNVYKEYTIQFVEETGSVASGVASGATASTGTLYAYNAALDDMVSYDDQYYVISDTTTLVSLQLQRFLTDMRGANIRIKSTERFDLGMMTRVGGGGQGFKNLVIKTYGGTGALIGTYKIANSYSAGSTAADFFLSCLVGPPDLNSTSLLSGVQPVITDSVYTYTVYSEDNAATQTSETLTFEIDKDCYKQDGIRVYWLNTLGRMDAFTFNFANEESIDVVRASFRKLTGSFTGAAFGYTHYETGKTNFTTQVDRKIKVRSDYINNAEADWLKNMVSSPIWWVELDGNLVSMTLDTNSYTIQTIQKNQVFSVEFDLMFSKSAYRQRL